MAGNVFGKQVTDKMVREFFPEAIEITTKQRANVAMQYKEGDAKDKVNAYVHKLKNEYGAGTSTLCMIYNATGHTLKFALNHPWEGHIWKHSYPLFIQNGQWAGFLHVADSDSPTGPSKEAVVYSGKNSDGIGRDWMLAWNNPGPNSKNHVYTEIREAGHYKADYWGYIYCMMEKQTDSHSDTWKGCYSTMVVSPGSTPELVAIMTLDDLDSDL